MDKSDQKAPSRAKAMDQNLDQSFLARLDHLESEVWTGVYNRVRQMRRMLSAVGALALLALFVGSGLAGATHGTRVGLHDSLTRELADSQEFLNGRLE